MSAITPRGATTQEKRLRLHQDVLDRCRMVIHKACKVGQLATPTDSATFTHVSKSLAANTEIIAELCNRIDVTITGTFDSLLKGFLLTSQSELELVILELFQHCKLLMGNPQSFVIVQQVIESLENTLKQVYELFTITHLILDSQIHDKQWQYEEILSKINLVIDTASKLEYIRSIGKPFKTTEAFFEAINSVKAITKQIPKSFHDSLQEVANNFSLWVKKDDSPRKMTILRQTKEELVKCLKVVVIHQMNLDYTPKNSSESRGITKLFQDTLECLSLHQNTVSAHLVVVQLSSRCEWFSKRWNSANTNQAELITLIRDQILIPNSLDEEDTSFSKYFPESPKKSRKRSSTKSRALHASVEAPISPSVVDQSPMPADRRNSFSIWDDPPPKPVTPSSDSIVKKNPRDRKSSAGTINRGQMRSLLKKAPSILDDMVDSSIASQARGKLSQVSSLDLHADILQVSFKPSLLSGTRSFKKSASSNDLSALETKLFSSCAQLQQQEPLSSQYQTIQIIFDALGGIISIISGSRPNPPPVEQEYTLDTVKLLNKKLEINPDMNVLNACIDGYLATLEIVQSELQDYTFEIQAIIQHLKILIKLITQKERTSKMFFCFLATVNRFFVLLSSYVQSQENLCLLLDEGDKYAQEHAPKSDEKIPPMWHEARNRNKFEVESPKELTKGTINSLVEALTDPYGIETQFNNTFFLTYRAFMTPADLMNKLFERFQVPEDFEFVRGKIQCRVMSVLRDWVKLFGVDIDADMLQALQSFVANPPSNSCEFTEETVIMTKSLEADLLRFVKEREQAKLIKSPSFTQSNISEIKVYNFLNLDAEKLAQMITVIDSDIYCRIERYELLQQAWSKPRLKHRSTHVLQLIQRLNRFTTWIASMIVWPETLKQRTAVLNHVIQIAVYLRNYHNYHALMGILAALSMSAVNRLKYTFAGIKKKYQSATTEMKTIFEATGSWKNYRKMLSEVVGPIVPYLGIFLTDITFIDDGNKTLLDGDKINFLKQKLIAKVLNKVLGYQTHRYEFSISNPEFSFVRDFAFTAETALYNLSLEREPRDITSAKELP